MVFKHKHIAWFCWVFSLLSLLTLYACDNGGNGAGDTGSVSFNLEWKSITAAQSDPGLTAAGDICSDYNIDETDGIKATLYNSSGDVVGSAKRFNCSDRQGSLTSVPAGTGYRLVVQAFVAGNPDWSGEVNDLSVTNGQTTDAGTITMTYTGSDTTSPEVTKVTPNASVTDAALNTTVSALFNEAMNGSTISSATFTLEKTSDSSSVAGKVSYDSTSMTATFTPDANLEAETEYLATLTTDIQDIAGNPLAGGNAADGSYQWTFTTGTTVTECTYAISPSGTSISLSGDAASRKVSVIPSDVSCAWTATSNDPWITIASGSSGTGNGQVTYKVSENSTGSARTGTITIAGITLTIQQYASGTTLPPMIWGAGNWDEVAWQ